MATYTTSSTVPMHSSSAGNAAVYVDSVATTAALSSTDILNVVRVPAGALVHRVVVKAPDLDTGTTLQAKLGFAYVDGTAVPSGYDTAVATAAAWAQSAATTTYELFPPVKLERDAFLQIVATANGAVNTGTVSGKVECEPLGVR